MAKKKKSDSLILSDAEAKAVEAIANATPEVIKAAGGALAYLRAVLGDLPHNTVGIVGDGVGMLREVTRAARAMLAQKVAEKLAKRGIKEPIPPSPSVLLPLAENAERETRPELADLWAELLATAMEPGRGRHVRRDYIAILAALEPLDALVLGVLYEKLDFGETEQRLMIHFTIAEYESRDLAVSLDHLTRLRLIEQRGEPFELTALGLGFIGACSPESKDENAEPEASPAPTPPTA